MSNKQTAGRRELPDYEELDMRANPEDIYSNLVTPAMYDTYTPHKDLVDNCFNACATIVSLILDHNYFICQDNGNSMLNGMENLSDKEIKRGLCLNLSPLKIKNRDGNDIGFYNFGLKGALARFKAIATIISWANGKLVKIEIDIIEQIRRKSFSDGIKIDIYKAADIYEDSDICSNFIERVNIKESSGTVITVKPTRNNIDKEYHIEQLKKQFITRYLLNNSKSCERIIKVNGEILEPININREIEIENPQHFTNRNKKITFNIYRNKDGYYFDDINDKNIKPFKFKRVEDGFINKHEPALYNGNRKKEYLESRKLIGRGVFNGYLLNDSTYFKTLDNLYDKDDFQRTKIKVFGIVIRTELPHGTKGDHYKKIFTLLEIIDTTPELIKLILKDSLITKTNGVSKGFLYNIIQLLKSSIINNRYDNYSSWNDQCHYKQSLDELKYQKKKSSTDETNDKRSDLVQKVPKESLPPAQDSSPPVPESSSPVLESSLPAQESSPPVPESSPPVLESSSPVLDSSPPVPKSSPPVLESSLQVPESSYPDTEHKSKENDYKELIKDMKEHPPSPPELIRKERFIQYLRRELPESWNIKREQLEKIKEILINKCPDL